MSTRDSDGNTPLHLIKYHCVLSYIFGMLEHDIQKTSLMKSKNSNGDTPLHMMECLSSAALLDILRPNEIIDILQMQNHQGDTILHKCVRRRRVNQIIRLLEGIYPKLVDRSCLLVTNRHRRKIMHELVVVYQDEGGNGLDRVPPPLNASPRFSTTHPHCLRRCLVLKTTMVIPQCTY